MPGLQRARPLSQPPPATRAHRGGSASEVPAGDHSTLLALPSRCVLMIFFMLQQRARSTPLKDASPWHGVGRYCSNVHCMVVGILFFAGDVQHRNECMLRAALVLQTAVHHTPPVRALRLRPFTERPRDVLRGRRG